MRYHLLNEARRRKISYENKEPISCEVYREIVPMLPKAAISTAEDVTKVVLKIASDNENLRNGNVINIGSEILGA